MSSLQITLNAEDTQAPFWLRGSRRMTDEELFQFCGANPALRIERTAEGEILIMAPTGGETAHRNVDLSAQLQAWAKRNGCGKAFDSNVAFALTSGAVLSPDASWVTTSRLETLTREQKRKFLPLCPDFVVELLSPTDRLTLTMSKMTEWIEGGARLGWLIDADSRTVYIFRPSQSVEKLVGPGKISGEGLLAGFELELEEIFAPL